MLLSKKIFNPRANVDQTTDNFECSSNNVVAFAPKIARKDVVLPDGTRIEPAMLRKLSKAFVDQYPSYLARTSPPDFSISKVHTTVLRLPS